MKYETIDSENIEELVNFFYLKIRQSPEIGSIFEKQIGTTAEDWESHLKTMNSFWRSILLREGSYRGNPMAAHRKLPSFPPEMFSVWLDLFEESVNALYTQENADLIFHRAQMIAQNLKYGIYQAGR